MVERTYADKDIGRILQDTILAELQYAGAITLTTAGFNHSYRLDIAFKTSLRLDDKKTG